MQSHDNRHAMIGHLPPARRFCAGCGLEVMWPIAPNGRRETKRCCSGCDREWYRNPDVDVLCLAHLTDSSAVYLLGVPLADFETVEDAARRTLSGHHIRGADIGASLTLFAVINDLDGDRLQVVFRAPITESDTNSLRDVCFDPWMRELVGAFRLELEAGRSHVYTGTVRNARLQLVRETAGADDL